MNKKLLVLVFAMLVFACKLKKENHIQNPFRASKYQSNKNYFRADASAQSTNYETSRDKALLLAKQRLASSIQTGIKSLSESYQNERNIDDANGDFNQRYQQLTREVTNLLLFDVAKIGEKTYKNNNSTFTTFVAVEARKKTIYANFKEMAKNNKSISESDKKTIENIVNKAISQTNDND